MKICVALLLSLGLGLCCAPNANAQSPSPQPAPCPQSSTPIPSMTITIFNDDPSGAYIFPVFTTGGAHFSDEVLAWSCANGNYTTTILSRIYINPTSGIAPNQSVTLQVPLYTKDVKPNRVTSDKIIDWWTGDTIELFFGTSNGPPRAYKELLAGNDPNNPKQQAFPSEVLSSSPLPTCNNCQMQFFFDTATIGKNEPSQLIEFNLGALQALAACQGPTNVNNPACLKRTAGIPNALDTRNVTIDMSYVNVAFGPATLAPFQNDQTGFVGTPQSAKTFSTALTNFINSNTCQTDVSPSSCNGWPQFVHTYNDKTTEVLLKLASPLEVFGRLSPPGGNAPTDLCGFTAGTACATPAGTLQWPNATNQNTAKLWPPLQVLLDNWVLQAGTLKNYPDTPQSTYDPTKGVVTSSSGVQTTLRVHAALPRPRGRFAPPLWT